MPRGRTPRFPVATLSAEDRARILGTVDARLVQAKHRFSLAALGCLRGALDAPQLVRQALDELDRARALLAKAEANVDG